MARGAVDARQRYVFEAERNRWLELVLRQIVIEQQQSRQRSAIVRCRFRVIEGGRH
jgi:GAF domain-containing protein